MTMMVVAVLPTSERLPDHCVRVRGSAAGAGGGPLDTGARHASLEGGSLAGSRRRPVGGSSRSSTRSLMLDQADPLVSALASYLPAVVADADPDLVVDLGYGDRDGLCIGVLQGVPERLLWIR